MHTYTHKHTHIHPCMYTYTHLYTHTTVLYGDEGRVVGGSSIRYIMPKIASIPGES